MNGQTQRLEKAMATMLRIIRDRPDRRKYMPIVQRLERAITSSKNDDAEFERIMGMAAELKG
ncbi:hypothetical protein HCZ23_12915 [Celeribacter sp. HF31]|uniref:hypothetical protein n=1 Tax=Celeribacter sp. HF31 TaxID=2721558 RepID=UPI001C37DBDB|nr:hypothetical protein [Celeribacter sp. HF31]NIY80366.1 hypothetical protein [Celeribacter sp. HF31]